MKTNVIKYAFIACFALIGPQVVSAGKTILVGEEIAKHIASGGLIDVPASEVMHILANKELAGLDASDWSLYNGFSWHIWGGYNNFKVEIEVSGDFTVTHPDCSGAILKGKITEAAQRELRVKRIFWTSLNWKLVEPLDDKGNVDKNAKLIVKYQYTYNELSRSDQIRIDLTINDILNQLTPIAPFWLK